MAEEAGLRPPGTVSTISRRHVLARIWHAGPASSLPTDPAPRVTCTFVVVGTGVDPVTLALFSSSQSVQAVSSCAGPFAKAQVMGTKAGRGDTSRYCPTGGVRGMLAGPSRDGACPYTVRHRHGTWASLCVLSELGPNARSPLRRYPSMRRESCRPSSPPSFVLPRWSCPPHAGVLLARSTTVTRASALPRAHACASHRTPAPPSRTVPVPFPRHRQEPR